jgi:integrase/recombinase XerD
MNGKKVLHNSGIFDTFQKKGSLMKKFVSDLMSAIAGLIKRKTKTFNESTRAPETLSELLDKFIAKVSVEENLSPGTLKKYRTYRNNIICFLDCTNRAMLRPDQFRPPVAEDFRLWLHQTLESCGKTHSSRHIELVRRSLKYAVTQEFIKYNPLADFETRRDKVKEVISLDDFELKLMLSHKFQTDIYRKVTNLFLFQCATGLSYADIYTHRYTKDPDGSEWFYNCREKTERPYWVPMFPMAKAIYTLYEGQLPGMTNQEYNRILKEVSGMLGINKRLTTHVARKTFATVMNDMGMSTKTISQMLGQSSVQVTETHYIRVNKTRIKREVMELQAAS